MLDSVLKDYGASEVSALDAYGDVFKLGTGFLTKAGEHRDSHDFNGNPIILGSFDEKIRREMAFEDAFSEPDGAVPSVCGMRWTSPIPSSRWSRHLGAS